MVRSFPVSSLFKTKSFKVHDYPHTAEVDKTLQVALTLVRLTLHCNLKKTCDFAMCLLPFYGLEQGWATYGPWAKCGPPRHFTRPETFFLFSMIDMQQ